MDKDLKTTRRTRSHDIGNIDKETELTKKRTQIGILELQSTTENEKSHLEMSYPNCQKPKPKERILKAATENWSHARNPQ